MVDPRVAGVVAAVGRIAAGGTINLLGTAFAVEKHRFATAAHNLSQSDAGLKIVVPRIAKLDEFQDTTNAQIQYAAATIVAYDAVRDIAIVEAPDLTCVFPYKLVGADQVPPGTAIATLGFPHADHGRLVLTLQTSTIGARVLLGASGVKTKHVVLNVQGRPGQSGGPVFDPTGNVCAMLLGSYAPGGGGGISLGGVDPHTLHQTTHAISAEYIKDML